MREYIGRKPDDPVAVNFFDKTEQKILASTPNIGRRWNFACALQPSATPRMPNIVVTIKEFVERFDPERTRVLFLSPDRHGAVLQSGHLQLIADLGAVASVEIGWIDAREQPKMVCLSPTFLTLRQIYCRDERIMTAANEPNWIGLDTVVADNKEEVEKTGEACELRNRVALRHALAHSWNVWVYFMDCDIAVLAARLYWDRPPTSSQPRHAHETHSGQHILRMVQAGSYGDPRFDWNAYLGRHLVALPEAEPGNLMSMLYFANPSTIGQTMTSGARTDRAARNPYCGRLWRSSRRSDHFPPWH